MFEKSEKDLVAKIDHQIMVNGIDTLFYNHYYREMFDYLAILAKEGSETSLQVSSLIQRAFILLIDLSRYDGFNFDCIEEDTYENLIEIQESYVDEFPAIVHMPKKELLLIEKINTLFKRLSIDEIHDLYFKTGSVIDEIESPSPKDLELFSWLQKITNALKKAKLLEKTKKRNQEKMSTFDSFMAELKPKVITWKKELSEIEIEYVSLSRKLLPLFGIRDAADCENQLQFLKAHSKEAIQIEREDNPYMHLGTYVEYNHVVQLFKDVHGKIYRMDR